MKLGTSKSLKENKRQLNKSVSFYISFLFGLLSEISPYDFVPELISEIMAVRLSSEGEDSDRSVFNAVATFTAI